MKPNILTITYRATAAYLCNSMSLIRLHRGFIRFLNDKRSLRIVPLAVVLALAVPAFTQDYDLSGKVGFVSLTTAQLKGANGGPADFAPHVLLRFTREGSSSGFLAITDKYGVAIIPIEAGTYCAEAYGVDGHRVALSEQSQKSLHRCFTATAGKMVEFSVALAADAKYGGDIPSLGVE